MEAELQEMDRWNIGSIIVNILLFVLKLAVGLFTMSMAVLSDSVDSGIDVLTSVMARQSVRIAREPADRRHTYGHGKYENLSGFVQALVLIVIAIFIIVESVRRLINGVSLEAIEYGIIIMVVSVIAKLLVSRNLLAIARKHDSQAMEANAVNLQADVWLSLGVLASLSAIWLFVGLYPDIVYLDPVVALFIAVFIIRAGYRIARKSSRDLLDETIPDSELEIIKQVLESHRDQYLEYHRFRARKSGNQRHIDMHLVVPKDKGFEEVHALTERIEAEIGSKLKNSTVVIHMEPCLGECRGCRLEGMRE